MPKLSSNRLKKISSKPIQVQHLSGDPLLGKLQALATNIRLGQEESNMEKQSSLLRALLNYSRKKF
jgi:hypothetical protein